MRNQSIAYVMPGGHPNQQLVLTHKATIWSQRATANGQPAAFSSQLGSCLFLGPGPRHGEVTPVVG